MSHPPSCAPRRWVLGRRRPPPPPPPGHTAHRALRGAVAEGVRAARKPAESGQPRRAGKAGRAAGGSRGPGPRRPGPGGPVSGAPPASVAPGVTGTPRRQAPAAALPAGVRAGRWGWAGRTGRFPAVGAPSGRGGGDHRGERAGRRVEAPTPRTAARAGERPSCADAREHALRAAPGPSPTVPAGPGAESAPRPRGPSPALFASRAAPGCRPGRTRPTPRPGPSPATAPGERAASGVPGSARRCRSAPASGPPTTRAPHGPPAALKPRTAPVRTGVASGAGGVRAVRAPRSKGPGGAARRPPGAREYSRGLLQHG